MPAAGFALFENLYFFLKYECFYKKWCINFSSSYILIDADPNHLGHGYNLEHRHLDIIHHWLDYPNT